MKRIRSILCNVGDKIGEKLYDTFPMGVIISDSTEGGYSEGHKGETEEEFLESAARLLGDSGRDFLGRMAAIGYKVDIESVQKGNSK